MGQNSTMDRILKILLIIFIISAFTALVIWGINAAAAGTHKILGDAAYQPFFGGFS